MPGIRELRQLAIAIETTEGTAESLTGADTVEVFDASSNFDDRRFERNPHRRKLGTAKSVGKLKIINHTFKQELRGSGTAATAPRIFRTLRACGCQQEAVKSIAIGAVTSGPFQHGETITGGTSGGTGRVIFPTANGAAVIYYVVISGTLQSGEVLTGGTSAATATSSGAPANAGFVIRPLTDSADRATKCDSATMRLLDGVNTFTGFGSRGRAKLMVNLGQTAMFEFTFSGVPTQPADSALLTSSLPAAEELPPVAIGLATTMGAYEPIFEKLELDLGVELAPRLSASDAQGILSFLVVGRSPSGSIDPEAVAEATKAFFDEWWDDTTQALDFTIGSTANNRFRCYIPQAQLQVPTEGEREKLLTRNIPFDVRNTAEDDHDWCILAY